MSRVDPSLAARLHQRANAARWHLSVAEFAAALERSATTIGAVDGPSLGRALDGLHLDDLALACACERGDDAAWEHFVREHRPLLYRAGTAIAGEYGRELADSLYAELFGLRERDGARQSLFRYFHGRSSLGTWLRSVLAQRHIDAIRSHQRFDPLPDEEDPSSLVADPAGPDAEARRQAALVRDALGGALMRLPARDRLRLAWYYREAMTLAQIGRLCQEHEATVSRHLTRTRKALRADVEAQLQRAGLGAREIDECLAAAAVDPGDADLSSLLPVEDVRKNTVDIRSKVEERS